MIVLKIGGGAGIDHEAIFRDLKARLDEGEQAIVVHGANHEMAQLSEQLGKPPRMITSVSGYESRYTDQPASTPAATQCVPWMAIQLVQRYRRHDAHPR